MRILITVLSMLGILTIVSCGSESGGGLSSHGLFDNATPVEASLRIIDSVKLVEEDFFFGDPTFTLMATNQSSSIKSMENGAIFSYSSEGQIEVYFDTNETIEGQSGLVMVAFDLDLTEEVAYVLYAGQDYVFKYDLESKNLISKTVLEMPDDQAFIFMPYFKWVKEKSLFIIGTGYADYATEKDFYENSKLLALFSEGGSHLASFGEFPDYFSEYVNFNTWVGFYHAFADSDYIYLLFGNSPEVYKYDFTGNLIEKFGQVSQNFDYSIQRYTQENPGLEAMTDLYYGLSKDMTKPIFYYFILDVKEMRDGYRDSDYWVVKYDAEAQTYSELIVPPNYKLLSNVESDTLYFFGKDNAYDEKYLIRGIIE